MIFGRYDKVMSYLERLFDISVEIKDKQGEVRLYFGLGEVYCGISMWKKLVIFLKCVFMIMKEIEDRNGE